MDFSSDMLRRVFYFDGGSNYLGGNDPALLLMNSDMGVLEDANYVTIYEAHTGKELWRFDINTGSAAAK